MCFGRLTFQLFCLDREQRKSDSKRAKKRRNATKRCKTSLRGKTQRAMCLVSVYGVMGRGCQRTVYPGLQEPGSEVIGLHLDELRSALDLSGIPACSVRPGPAVILVAT